MADTDILIAIKTALEAGGLDQAKTKLGELIDKQKEAKTASADQTIETTKLDQQMTQLQGTLLKIPAALKGSPEAIQSLTRDIGKMGASLGPIAAVAAAAFGGWKLGKLIDDTFGLSDKISRALVPAIEDIEGPARKARAELEKMDAVDFKNLEANLNKIEAQCNAILQKIAAAAARAREAAGAEGNLALAQAEAMPEGPGRDRAIAAVRLESERRKAAIDLQEAADKRKALEDEQKQRDEQINDVRNRMLGSKFRLQDAGKALSDLGPDATAEEQARKSQALKTAQEDYDRELANYTKTTEELGKAADKTKEQLQDLASKVSTINKNLKAEETRSATESSKIDAKVTAEEAKAEAERQKQAAKAELEKVKAGADALREQVPGLKKTEEEQKKQSEDARSAAERFKETGEYVDAEGRTKRISRSGMAGKNKLRELEAAAQKEEEDYVTSQNVVQAAQTAVDQSAENIKQAAQQIEAAAKSIEGSIGAMSGNVAGAFANVVATVNAMQAQLNNLQGQINNPPY